MELITMEQFDGSEWGIFPTFPKGSVFEVVGGDGESPHWFPCIVNGMGFWTPDIYMDKGVLNRDYNPTSITVEKGQTLTLIELVFEWLYVKDENGNEGWIPASKVISKA